MKLSKIFLSLIFLFLIHAPVHALEVLQLDSQKVQELSYIPGVHSQRILLAQISDCQFIADPVEKQRCLHEKQSKPSGLKKESTPNNNAEGLSNTINALSKSGSSKDSALIVFAVIGVVVLIVWIPYTLKYIYNWIKGDDVSGRWQVETVYTRMFKSDIGQGISRSGNLYGARLTLSMGDEIGSQMGLVVEGGRHSITDKAATWSSSNDGSYIMGGPAIYWGFKEMFLGLELTGGTSDLARVGLMSKANGALQFSISHFTFGLDLGAMYTRIKEFRGLTSNIDSFQFFLSTAVGVQF